jgi:sarcosine oxidase, subunit beta
LSGPRTAPTVIIIGGGLHGCCTALHLARAGAEVTVIERDFPGRHASGANAGGVRTLNRHLAEVPLALAAIEIWRRMEAEVGDSCGYVECGQIRVAESAAELEALVQRAALLRDAGYKHETVIDRDELRQRMPALGPHCVGAIYCAGEGYAEPYRTALTFARAAEHAGVKFRLGLTVEAFERTGHLWRVATGNEELRADTVVNCAGAWGAAVAALVSDYAPLDLQALMMSVTARVEKFVTPVVGAAGRPLSLKQMSNGTVVIGGGFQGIYDAERGALVDFARLAENLRTAAELFPILDDVPIVRCWAGVEGKTPDQIPIIGRSLRNEGLFHIFGFCGHGFALAPVIGKLAAKSILSETEEPLFQPFSLSRFPARDFSLSSTSTIDRG